MDCDTDGRHQEHIVRKIARQTSTGLTYRSDQCAQEFIGLCAAVADATDGDHPGRLLSGESARNVAGADASENGWDETPQHQTG